MARDTDGLKRLKATQDSAHKAMTRARKERDAANKSLKRAYTILSRYEKQGTDWEHYQTVLKENGRRIRELQSLQQQALEGLKSPRASAIAKHTYTADDDAERIQLVEETRVAKKRYESALRKARTEFHIAWRAHDAARDDHERSRAEFEQARTEYNAALKKR